MGWKLPEENPGTEKRGSSPRRKERMPGVGVGEEWDAPRDSEGGRCTWKVKTGSALTMLPSETLKWHVSSYFSTLVPAPVCSEETAFWDGASAEAGGPICDSCYAF